MHWIEFWKLEQYLQKCPATLCLPDIIMTEWA
jgi:hypothetical protein